MPCDLIYHTTPSKTEQSLTKTSMAAEEEEEEESILHLFDLYWFKHQILKNPKPLSPNPSQKQPHNVIKESTKPTNPSPLQVTTPSIDHHSFISKHGGVESPTSVLALPKDTQVIYSDDEPVIKKNKKKNHRRKRAGSKRSSRFRKSVTELEHEELKGFKELGFVFPEEAKVSPWLVSILPGLQKQGSVDGDEEARGEVYLSKTWKKNTSSEMKMMVMMMKNWRLPSLSNENDMKRHLRVWAHVVASVVT